MAPNTTETGQSLVKALRMYTFISQVREAIVHVKDERGLFNKICDIAIDTGKFNLVWIGFIDAPNRALRKVAGSPHGEKFAASSKFFTMG